MSPDDFILPQSTYLLSHSVGRPLKSAESALHQAVFEPWAMSGQEPWDQWLGVVDSFTAALARLFNHKAASFCPQVNLSSGLTKLLMALPRLGERPCVLMAEQDFPSMGFAMRKALPAGAIIKFLPADRDLTLLDSWTDCLTTDVDLVFITHAYSNTGQLAPVAELVALARSVGALSIVDVAQSAGIVPIDLAAMSPDFMLGSSVKWLCGGPGAGYLWVNETMLDECQPRDVGWFSHENPFEFDIDHFAYHPSALRFWGGTPSVLPFALAANSIDYFAAGGIEGLREHNQRLITRAAEALAPAVRSPDSVTRRNGTLVLNFGEQTTSALAQLTAAGVSVDQRAQGLRVSPHIYNDEDDIQQLIGLLEPFCWP